MITLFNYRWKGNIQQHKVPIYINAQWSFWKITPLVSTPEEDNNFAYKIYQTHIKKKYRTHVILHMWKKTLKSDTTTVKRQQIEVNGVVSNSTAELLALMCSQLLKLEIGLSHWESQVPYKILKCTNWKIFPHLK